MVKCKNGTVKMKGNPSLITAEILVILMSLMQELFIIDEEEGIEEFTQTAIGILSSRNSNEMQKFLKKDLIKRMTEHCGKCDEEMLEEIDEAIRDNFEEE